jgi:hypothetical protein
MVINLNKTRTSVKRTTTSYKLIVHEKYIN